MIHRQIHILRDPWIPLDQNGQEELASVVELLTGSKDAPDLLHPRDDYRFFARMLLSSLVQALFEPENEAEIEARIAHPMSLREVEDRIAEVEDDFWLVHPEPRKGFLQTAKAVEKKDKAEGLSVDALDSLAESHLLYRRLSRRPAVCATCAVCALYGLQATARSAGSGFVPSIRGGAPMSTLLSLGADKDRSVRADVWVNVLARTVLPRFELTRSTGNPWVQKARSVPRKPHRFMVAEGLLWQPRALRMVAHEQGTCSSCGRRMEILFAASGVHPGVESVQGESAFFAHPYCPTVKPGKHLSTPGNTPFWCSIGEVLPGLTNERNDKGDAAPVVLHQVATDRTHGLLLLEIASNNAKILHVIHESLGLPRQLRIDYRATARRLVARAANALKDIRTALVPSAAKNHGQRSRSHDKAVAIPSRLRKLELPDVDSAFWQRTEEPFFCALRHASDSASELLFCREVNAVALELFEWHVAPYLDDARTALRVARARVSLRRNLIKTLSLNGHPASGVPGGVSVSLLS